MSILIKGVEMPTDGCRTINIHADGSVYVLNTYPTEVAVCVDVPTPHGRLIGAEELTQALADAIKGTRWSRYEQIFSLADMESYIEMQNTIIEAEGE